MLRFVIVDKGTYNTALSGCPKMCEKSKLHHVCEFISRFFLCCDFTTGSRGGRGVAGGGGGGEFLTRSGIIPLLLRRK
eukprot:TRINITY_DN16077_c0_g1_i1.p3 TRINITY_DN16077_c0_g1~~TRINITY_DN16077_c0_g1_i1.p3  ORF type:complete len:78 (-),score=11.90 TRINITY_DN16077_c0_g1_i1:380-613(-)